MRRFAFADDYVLDHAVEQPFAVDARNESSIKNGISLSTFVLFSPIFQAVALAFDDAFLDDRSRPEAGPPGAGEPRRPRPLLRVVGSAAAMELDRRLLALSGRAARCRFLEGRVAAPLLARRGWTALGFARLGDYSRERLGIGARSVEENVRVATSLEALPCIAAAFLDGTLSWTATRLVTGIATPGDEAGWIEKARRMDARALESTIRQARAPDAAATTPSEEAAGDSCDDPRVRWSVRVSSLGRRMWRAACELAERTAGSKLTPARVLELVAAEASGSVPRAAGSNTPRSPDPAIRDLLDKLRSASDARASVAGTAAVGDDAGKGDSRSSGATTSGTGTDDVASCNIAPRDASSDDTPTEGAVSNDSGGAGERGAATGERPSGHSGYDWREGLERRDPELAAFLANCEREEAAAREVSNRRHDASVSSTRIDRQESSTADSGDASTTTHRPYDWREGLAERDPQLAAFLAACEAEDAARECADAGTRDGDAATLERGDGVTGKHGGAATHGRGEAAGSAPPNSPPPFATILREVAAREDLPWLVPAVLADATGPSAWLERHMHAIESADPFVIDERLRVVRSRVHRLDFDLAALLREAVRIRLYRDFGFANLEDYVESRLGICPRTAWTLLAIERACSRTSPLLADAWRDGRIHTMAAHTILRVLGQGHDEDWIARARAVTLRRLADEVDWARARLAEGCTAEPPPEGLDLTRARLEGVTADELQMRAHGAQPAEATAPSDADEQQMRAHEATAQKNAAAVDPGFVASEQIAFFAPESVCILATETMLALRTGSEPRGRAFERMLALAMLEWMGAPRHRDPVFERDGWCCSVPGCTSRRNLHDHHIVFRSQGGDKRTRQPHHGLRGAPPPRPAPRAHPRVRTRAGRGHLGNRDPLRAGPRREAALPDGRRPLCLTRVTLDPGRTSRR